MKDEMEMSQAEIQKRLNRLRKDLAATLVICGSSVRLEFVVGWLAQVDELRSGTMLKLPGMPEAESPRAKAKSQQEVEDYFRQLRLPQSDAVYFWNKCVGCGWRNGRNPIKDWKATVKAWQAAGYFPSQRANGQGVKPSSIVDKLVEREAREARRLE